MPLKSPKKGTRVKVPMVPVQQVMESNREIESSGFKDPDIGNLSPATKQRLANRRILFGQASARNSRWYHDLVKDTFEQDNTFKPMAGDRVGKDVQEEQRLLRGATHTAEATARTVDMGPIIPKDSRSPSLQVPEDLLTARQSAYGIRAAKGPRRHDLGVMLHSGDLPMATGVIPKEMTPISFRTERRKPAAVSEGGRVSIGRKGGVNTLAMLLQKPDGASKGRRLQAAQSLAVLVETEEHARLLVATGKHAAQPVVDLLKCGNLEEKVAAAGILTRVCKVRDLRPIIARVPGLCDALFDLLRQHEHGTGNAAFTAVCNIFAELGRVPLVGNWAMQNMDFVDIVIKHIAKAESSPEIAEAAAWALAALTVQPPIAEAIMAEPRLVPTVATTLQGPYIRTATACSALLHELACYPQNLGALEASQPVRGILKVIRGSNGDRTALHSCLCTLQHLSTRDPIVEQLIAAHCPTILLELLMYIKNEDTMLLAPLLHTLKNMTGLPQYRVLLLHQGLVLQTLPILQWGSGTLREIALQMLTELAADTLCATNIVNAGGIPLILVSLETDESETSLQLESIRALGALGKHKDNHVAISRGALPFILKQLVPGGITVLQIESCEALKGLVMTTEIKVKLLQTGMMQILLDLLESVHEIPEADDLVQKIMELLHLFSTDADSTVRGVMQNGTVGDLGGMMQTSRMATTKIVKKYMSLLQREWANKPRTVLDWLKGGHRDKEEAAARVIAKLSINSTRNMLNAMPELVGILGRLLTTPQKNFQGIGASALATIAMAGPDIRKQLSSEGIIASLVRMLHMQARTSWIPGTKLLQRLAADEDRRKEIVDGGGVEGLLDILEHSPEESGRIAAVKALTTLAISSSCREIMTGRGLMPILDMLRDEVSSEYGQAVALRALQNFAINGDCAMAMAKKAIPRCGEYLACNCMELVLGSGKLLRNLACHGDLDLEVAVVALPQMVDLLYLEDIQIAQITCELLGHLSERSELQSAWIQMGIPDCLVKILLLGENPIKYYAGRVLERMGAGLTGNLYERVQEARNYGPDYVARMNKTKNAWGKLKADVKRLNLDFVSEDELLDVDDILSPELTQQDLQTPLLTQRSHGARSWNDTIGTLKECGAIQFTPRPTKEEEAQKWQRPSSAKQWRPMASHESSQTRQRPWSAASTSLLGSAGKRSSSSSSRPGSAHKQRSRPGSALSLSSHGSPSGRSKTPTVPHPWGWDSSDADGRTSRCSDEWSRIVGIPGGRLGIAMPQTPRSGSLAMMRPPTNNDITMPRTKRKAPALWRDIKGAMKMLNLQTLVKAKRASNADQSAQQPSPPSPRPPAGPPPPEQAGSGRTKARVGRLVLPGTPNSEGPVSKPGGDDVQPSTDDHGDLSGGERVIPEAALEAFIAIGQDEAETEPIDVSPLDKAAASQGGHSEASHAEGAPPSAEDQKTCGDSTKDATPQQQVDSTVGEPGDESPSPSAEEPPAGSSEADKAGDVRGSQGASGQTETACSSPRSIADTADAFGSQIQTANNIPGNNPQEVSMKSDTAHDAKDPKHKEQEVLNESADITDQGSKSLAPADQVDEKGAGRADGTTGTGPEAKTEDEDLSELELQKEVDKDLTMAASQASAPEDSYNATDGNGAPAVK